MATRTVQTMTDDLDPSLDEGVETRTFALDGTEYSIDLGDKNGAELDKVLAAYIGAARRAGGSTRGRASKPSSKDSSPDAAAVRSWAQANNVPMSARGRIKKDVLIAFQEAGN